LQRWGYYGLALLLVGVAALLRWGLSDVLRPVEFLPFGLAWVGAAVLGGLGPGLLAAVASWLCVELLFDSTPGHLGFRDAVSVTRLLAYLAGGLVVGGVGEKLRRARSRGRRHAQELAAADRVLRESEFHLAQAQQIAHLGSWSWDIVEGRLYWSDETYRLYGLQPGESEPCHEDFLNFVHPEDRPRVQQSVREALARGGVHQLDFRIVPRGGQERYVHCETQVILDREGHPIKAEGALQDITERKRAEQELRELNATLESRVARRTAQLQQRAGQLQKLTLELTEAEERERKRLAGILHDDLQQVLAAAKLHVDLLSSRVKNDTESHEVAEQAKRLLVDAIAKSRSLSHELSAPGLSRSNLREPFEWLAGQIQQKHRFTVHLEMGEQIEVASEPLRVLLYKAAQELLFNAIKHAGVHEAKLRVRRQRDRLQLLVSDAGRGFEFDSSGPALGAGLLSIRERIEYLGGRMKIRSAAGKGSTFLIAVPDTEVSP
jgi:PAS domain S-box-containing protein